MSDGLSLVVFIIGFVGVLSAQRLQAFWMDHGCPWWVPMGHIMIGAVLALIFFQLTNDKRISFIFLLGVPVLYLMIEVLKRFTAQGSKKPKV